MKKMLLAVVVGLVLMAAPKPALAYQTRCVSACDQTVQYWCNGGALWQVTGGDQWFFLQFEPKTCY